MSTVLKNLSQLGDFWSRLTRENVHVALWIRHVFDMFCFFTHIFQSIDNSKHMLQIIALFVYFLFVWGHLRVRNESLESVSTFKKKTTNVLYMYIFSNLI